MQRYAHLSYYINYYNCDEQIQYEMEEKKFTVRAYGFGELASLYSPKILSKNAAYKLTRWIKINKNLTAELSELGFYSGVRDLSPKMVEIIVKYVGEP